MQKMLILLVLLLTISTCEKNPGIQEPEMENGLLSVQLDKKSMPDDVMGISGMLYRSGFDTIYFDFVMEEQYAYALVENIPVDLWTIKIDAFNFKSEIIYSGISKVRIIAGQITPIRINLSQIGGLEISVTWEHSREDDHFEENDRLSEAAALYEYTYYSDLFISTYDDDWYSMSISADSLSIKCDFIHLNGDINIDLVDKYGTVLTTSQSDTDNERINYIVGTLDTYYIHVYQASGTNNTYTIWWDDIWQGE